jgi:hypothetical protein
MVIEIRCLIFPSSRTHFQEEETSIIVTLFKIGSWGFRDDVGHLSSLRGGPRTDCDHGHQEGQVRRSQTSLFFLISEKINLF